MFKNSFKIGSKEISENNLIGSGHPCFIIAEMSANHNQDFDTAVKIIQAAKDAGANAIKLQTYTPATLTINVTKGKFIIPKGNTFAGVRNWSFE